MNGIGVKTEQVRAIDTYKVLITFSLKEEMVLALQDKKETMLSIVDEVRNWLKRRCVRFKGCGWNVKA